VTTSTCNFGTLHSRYRSPTCLTLGYYAEYWQWFVWGAQGPPVLRQNSDNDNM